MSELNTFSLNITFEGQPLGGPQLKRSQKAFQKTTSAIDELLRRSPTSSSGPEAFQHLSSDSYGRASPTSSDGKHRFTSRLSSDGDNQATVNPDANLLITKQCSARSEQKEIFSEDDQDTQTLALKPTEPEKKAGLYVQLPSDYAQEGTLSAEKWPQKCLTPRQNQSSYTVINQEG